MVGASEDTLMDGADLANVCREVSDFRLDCLDAGEEVLVAQDDIGVYGRWLNGGVVV